MNFDYPKNSIFEVIRRSQLKKLLLNYPSRVEVQMHDDHKFLSLVEFDLHTRVI